MSAQGNATDWREIKPVGLMGTIGPLLSKRDGAKWRYGLQTDDRHTNFVGIVHGGTIAAIVDQAMSLVGWEAAERQPLVTVHMDTTFLSAAKPGDFLEVDAVLQDKKGSLVFMEANVTSGDRLIAKATGIMKISKSRPKENQNGQ